MSELELAIQNAHAAALHYRRIAAKCISMEQRAIYESMAFDEARHEEALKEMTKDK